jgi:hypothetical protein
VSRSRQRPRREASEGRWKHPLLIGVVVAVIGALGAITAALVGSGGGGEPKTSMPARIDSSGKSSSVAITAVVLASDGHGGFDLKVRGTSHGLQGTDIYAVARPPSLSAQPAPAGSAALQNTWDVSGPAVLDKHGSWSATIHLNRVERRPLSVVAVEWQTAGCPPTAECTQVDPETTLQQGPLAGGGVRSAAFQIRP